MTPKRKREAERLKKEKPIPPGVVILHARPALVAIFCPEEDRYRDSASAGGKRYHRLPRLIT